MKYFIIFVLMVGSMMSQFTHAFGGASGATDPRILEFKKKIRFDEAFQHEPIEEHVEIDLSTFPAPPHLGGWTVVERHHLQREDGENILHWQFEKDDALFTLILTIYPPNNNLAAEKFIQTASSTTRMEIPYIKGPSDLGTLCVVDEGDDTTVMWVYRNAFVKVARYQSDVPHIEIARWIQKHLETKIKSNPKK